MPEDPEYIPPTVAEILAATFQTRRQNVLTALAHTGQAEALTDQMVAFLQGWFAAHLAYVTADPDRMTGASAFVTALEAAGITDPDDQAAYKAQGVRCYSDHFALGVYQIAQATLDATADPGEPVRAPFESAYQDAMAALATAENQYDIASLNIGSVVVVEIRALQADPSGIAPLTDAYADWQALQGTSEMTAQGKAGTDAALVAWMRSDLQALFAFPGSLIDGEEV